ncbi:radial spoke protein 3-domain-containing protein [Pavlovales sp. CCMP2436]|nr:radial spoke protein 3-domain-containing protein [Pavlovales sp. CCMP2436]
MSASLAYQHAEAPRSVAANRGTKSKYRPPPQQEQFGNSLVGPTNIMFDRRVVRGNTYSAQIIPPAMQAEMQARMELSKPAKKSRMPMSRDSPRDDVAPVDNRKHMDIQTEAYLEELTDRVVEADMDTQTDAFLDRPSAPIFVPMKTGVDADTQIYEGDLFDFDVEVDPILEVLVGKTLEQSMLEVLEEEELAAMKEHQEHFEQIRNVELAETQRMEEAEKRRFEEKERRVAQEQARVQREAQIHEKVAAHKFTKGYLQELHSAVFQNLKETGFFYDPLEREVTTEFLPWLVGEVQTRVQSVQVGRDVVDALLRSAVEQQQALLEQAALLHGGVEAQLIEIARKEADAIAAALAAAEALAAEEAAALAAAEGAPGTEEEGAE